MGSPNFNTSTDFLNLGYQPEFDDSLSSEENHENDETEILRSEIEEEISKFPKLFFHNIVVDSGYHSGFQVYIETSFLNRENYINQAVYDWERYKEFDTPVGNYEMQDCDYFNSNIKNITHFSLRNAIDREAKVLHNLLLKVGEYVGLKEVSGKSWTSSLTPIYSKAM